MINIIKFYQILLYTIWNEGNINYKYVEILKSVVFNLYIIYYVCINP